MNPERLRHDFISSGEPQEPVVQSADTKNTKYLTFCKWGHVRGELENTKNISQVSGGESGTKWAMEPKGNQFKLDFYSQLFTNWLNDLEQDT